MTDFVIGYSVPFDVYLPIWNHSGPRLTGRVYDAESNEGLAGVLILLGTKMALTDKNGRFAFGLPGSGIEYLSLDPASIDLERVSLIDLPVTVSAAEEDIEIDIPVVRASIITGDLILFGLAEGDYLENRSSDPGPVSGIPHAVVELRSRDRAFRALTNRHGAFRIDHVPPGQYEARVIKFSAPPNHRLERNKVDLQVAPGGQYEVHFRLVPSKRVIRIIDGGSVLRSRPVVPHRPDE